MPHVHMLCYAKVPRVAFHLRSTIYVLNLQSPALCFLNILTAKSVIYSPTTLEESDFCFSLCNVVWWHCCSHGLWVSGGREAREVVVVLVEDLEERSEESCGLQGDSSSPSLSSSTLLELTRRKHRLKEKVLLMLNHN